MSVPYISDHGDLIIPSDSPPRFHHWNPNQNPPPFHIAEILEKIKAGLEKRQVEESAQVSPNPDILAHIRFRLDLWPKLYWQHTHNPFADDNLTSKS